MVDVEYQSSEKPCISHSTTFHLNELFLIAYGRDVLYSVQYNPNTHMLHSAEKRLLYMDNPEAMEPVSQRKENPPLDEKVIHNMHYLLKDLSILKDGEEFLGEQRYLANIQEKTQIGQRDPVDQASILRSLNEYAENDRKDRYGDIFEKVSLSYEGGKIQIEVLRPITIPSSTENDVYNLIQEITARNGNPFRGEQGALSGIQEDLHLFNASDRDTKRTLTALNAYAKTVQRENAESISRITFAMDGGKLLIDVVRA